MTAEVASDHVTSPPHLLSRGVSDTVAETEMGNAWQATALSASAMLLWQE